MADTAVDVSANGETQNLVAENVEAHGEEELNFGLQEFGMRLSITIPQAHKPLEISARPSTLVQDIHSVIVSSPEGRHISSFYLTFKQKKLSEVEVLENIPDLVSGSTLALHFANYSEKSARAHVKITERLLRHHDEKHDEYNPVSLLKSITQEGLQPRTKGEPVQPKPVSLSTVFSSLVFPQCTPAYKNLSYSGYNPPTRQRALHGDLFYLEFESLENKWHCITASTSGFFLNKSSKSNFNPAKANEKFAPESHHLFGLLSKLSSRLGSVAAEYKLALSEAGDLDVARLSIPGHSWIAPVPPKESLPAAHDGLRAVDLDLVHPDGVSPPQNRDWNDEYLGILRLPVGTPEESLLRERVYQRFVAEYTSACVKVARDIVHGNLMAMNFMDPLHQHLFLWNNVFFSFALDGRGIYKNVGGDHAAHAAASNELNSINVINMLAPDNLYTLPTVLIDYLGYRIVAQTTVPGILRQDRGAPIVQGFMDDDVYVSDVKATELLTPLAEKLKILPHKFIDKDGKEHDVVLSTECKVIRAMDGNHYVLDVHRTTPVDICFIEGKYMDKTWLPEWTPRHRAYVLRHEFLATYPILKELQRIQTKAAEEKAKMDAQEKKEESEETKKAESNETQKVAPEENAPLVPVPVSNPDLFTQFNLGAEESVEESKKVVHELCSVLNDVLIPNFAIALATRRRVFVDGAELTEAMHEEGINIRYLGRLAGILMNLFSEVQSVSLGETLQLIVTEIIVRSAKHLLRERLRDRGRNSSNYVGIVAEFLNQLLAFRAEVNEKSARVKMEKKEVSLWEDVRRVAFSHFQFKLSASSANDFAVQKFNVLRSLCRQMGIQLAARDYDFAALTIINEEDILDLVPVYRAFTLPLKEDLTAVALQLAGENKLEEAKELMNQALNNYMQIYGPLHEMVGRTYQSMSLLLSLENENVLGALSAQERALVIFEKVLGVDHPDTIQAYMKLGALCTMVGASSVALSYLYHAKNLLCLLVGDAHPTLIPLQDTITQALIGLGDNQAAKAQCIQMVQLQQLHPNAQGLQSLHGYRTLGSLMASTNDFLAAIQCEKVVYQITVRELGKEHKLALDSRERLLQYTQMAVKKGQHQPQSQPRGNSRIVEVNADGVPVTHAPFRPKNKKREEEVLADSRNVDDLMNFINKPSSSKSKNNKKK